MSAPLDIRFFVAGKAVAKGNHDAFPIARGKCAECRPGKRCGRRNCFGGTIVGTVVSDDNAAELKAWQEFVHAHAISARNEHGGRLVMKPGALEARMVFLMQRPNSHYTGRGMLSAEGQRHALPTTRPDFDKLARAIADGLTGAVCEDDSQLAVAPIAKVWADGGKPGVLVRVREIGGSLSWIDDELAQAGIRTQSTAQGALL